MQVSTSAYYAWKNQPERTEKTQQKKRLEDKTRELFEMSKHSYGTRRLSDALNKAGYQAGRDKVRRLMKQLGLEVHYPKRFKVTTDSDHHETISPNTLNRQFEVGSPNTVWTTDITYIWTLEGWLYLAVVIDLFSRQVVGWAITDHIRASLCVSGL